MAEYIDREKLLRDIDHYHVSDGKFQLKIPDKSKIGCEHCAPLLACPVGEKRRVHICGDRTFDLTEIVLDRYKDHTDVFIHTEYGNDGFYHNTAFYIEYCPFCGRKLKENSDSVWMPIPTYKEKENG